MHFFNFIPQANVLPANGILPVELVYDFPKEFEKRFSVRVISRDSDASVWNSIGNRWISKAVPWTGQLPLADKFLVKLENLENPFAELYFEILDKKTSQIYLTPVKRIWANEVYTVYVKGLNARLMTSAVLSPVPAEEFSLYEVSPAFGKNHLILGTLLFGFLMRGFWKMLKCANEKMS